MIQSNQMTNFAEVKQRANKILDILKIQYPTVACTLDYQSPFELAIATILSAQCTDKRVNLVAGPLFARFASPLDFAEAPLEEIEEAIKSTGFYRNKAKNIQLLCRLLVNQYEGRIPETLEELVALPGIGRKTANVILGNAFGLAAGIAVDTHVLRLSRRIGLTKESTPPKVERDLMALFPKEEWIGISHRLIFLGRGPCQARKPDCKACCLEGVCHSYGTFSNGKKYSTNPPLK